MPDALPLITEAARSSASQPMLQTVVLGLIMVVGTGLLMWLILKFDGRK